MSNTNECGPCWTFRTQGFGRRCAEGCEEEVVVEECSPTVYHSFDPRPTPVVETFCGLDVRLVPTDGAYWAQYEGHIGCDVCREAALKVTL